MMEIEGEKRGQESHPRICSLTKLTQIQLFTSPNPKYIHIKFHPGALFYLVYIFSNMICICSGSFIKPSPNGGILNVQFIRKRKTDMDHPFMRRYLYNERYGCILSTTFVTPLKFGLFSPCPLPMP